MSLYDDPDVRTDMNNIRRTLANKNPSGYSIPLTIRFNGSDSVKRDVLPLFFLSRVVQQLLPRLKERDDSSHLDIPGRTCRRAVDILLSYCDGSSRSSNWAADLDETPEVAPYVWELAQVFELKNLERFTRKAAFEEETGALNPKSACLLYKKSKQYPDLNRRAFLYIARNFMTVVNTRTYFVHLTYIELHDILVSQHLCATEKQRFQAMNIWCQGPRRDAEWYDDDEEQFSGRLDRFYQLAAKIHFALVNKRETEILRYMNYEATESGMPPRRADITQRIGRRRRYCFRLKRYLEALKVKSDGYYVTPRFKGQFQFGEYYWQLELVFYDEEQVADPPAMGMYLRLLHGTDKAGKQSRQQVVGVQTDFTLRLHLSKDVTECYRSACFSADMMNLPGGNRMHGYRTFVGKRSLQKVLKSKRGGIRDLYASVEMRKVRELLSRNRWS